MEGRNILIEKARHSTLMVGIPDGAHLYKGFCVLPGSRRYFSANAEVDAYEQLVVDEHLKHGGRLSDE